MRRSGSAEESLANVAAGHAAHPSVSLAQRRCVVQRPPQLPALALNSLPLTILNKKVAVLGDVGLRCRKASIAQRSAHAKSPGSLCSCAAAR